MSSPREQFSAQYDSFGNFISTAPAVPQLDSALPNKIDGYTAPSSIGTGNTTGQINVVNGFLQSSNFVTGSTGWQIKYDGTLEANSGTFRGSLVANSLDIPDTTTANSFHVDNTGNAWWGATTLGGAIAKVLKTGIATFTNVSITGGSITSTPISSIPNSTSTDISLLEYTHDLVFSVASATQVNWTSGTITLSNGRTFSISSGNTGTMAARTFIYLDTGASSTVLQTTTTASTAMGANKLLISVAQNGAGQATFQVYGGAGGLTLKSAQLTIAAQGWNQTCTFSSASATQVNWTSGTFTTADGTSYSITSGNTGTMSALTYIYLDIGTSITVLQTTTSATTAVGDGKVLIAVAKNNTGGAIVQVFGGTGGIFMDGSNLVTGSVLSGQLGSGAAISSKANLALRGWTQTSAFTVSSATVVAWGAGTFTASDGTAYSISASNTGTMAAKTYVYLDIAISTTAYQVSTTATDAVGDGKVLIAICQNNTTEAVFMLLNNNAYNIDASNIVASSITANEIAASTITGAKIAATTIAASNIVANTITASQIAANTITASQIAAATITTNEIAANTIVANNIAASTITSAKMSVTQLSAIAADLGAITAGTIVLNTAGYVQGGQTAYNTGTGFFLGYSGAAYKFSIGVGGGTTNSLTWDGATLTVNGYVQSNTGKFGGDGSDGALSISSGTTTIDLGSANYVVKNYSSISITGTAKVAFSNPATTGTIVVLKSQGAVTVTSSTVPAIDLRLMGGAGGVAGAGAGFSASGTNGSDGFGTMVYPVAGLGGTLTTASILAGGLGTRSSATIAGKAYNVYAGSGGGGGGQSSSATALGGAGGRGGGGLIIECNGALNITSTINASGQDGAAGAAPGGGGGSSPTGASGGAGRIAGGDGTAGSGAVGSGGGGGAGGGAIVIIYNTLTANTGTYTVAGGAAGASTGGAGAAGAGGNGHSLVALNTQFL